MVFLLDRGSGVHNTVVVANRGHEGVDVLDVSDRNCDFQKCRTLEITRIASHGSLLTTARIGKRSWNV